MKSIYSNFVRGSLFFLLLFCAEASFSQSIRSSVDKKQILIGEQITFRMSIGLPSPDYHVEINVPDTIPHFDVLQKLPGSATDKQNNYSWEYKLVFTSFDSGTWTFPPLTYRISHLNTASQALATESFPVNVGYMPIDKSGKPRDIKTILDVSYFDWFWIYIAGGILLLLILLYILYRYLKKRKKAAPERAALSAYEEALKELDILRAANEKQTLPVKEFHTRLAEVFKEYYSQRTTGNFRNKTSAEILSVLRSHELKAETSAHAAEAFKTGDAVKFAKYRATYTENEAALNYLKSAIERNRKFIFKKSVTFVI